MRLTSKEVQWMECWFRTILPQDSETFLPGADALPLRSFIRDYFSHTPAGSSMGIRLASLLLTLLLCLRKLKPLTRIPRSERNAFLARISSSKVYLLRELPLLLKLTAFLAWDGQHRVHRALGVTGPLGKPPQWLTRDDAS